LNTKNTKVSLTELDNILNALLDKDDADYDSLAAYIENTIADIKRDKDNKRAKIAAGRKSLIEAYKTYLELLLPYADSGDYVAESVKEMDKSLAELENFITRARKGDKTVLDDAFKRYLKSL